MGCKTCSHHHHGTIWHETIFMLHILVPSSCLWVPVISYTLVCTYTCPQHSNCLALLVLKIEITPNLD